MSVKLLTEHHLEFLSLNGGYTGSSEYTLVKMPHCWKSHVTAPISCGIVSFNPDPVPYLCRDDSLLLFQVASCQLLTKVMNALSMVNVLKFQTAVACHNSLDKQDRPNQTVSEEAV